MNPFWSALSRLRMPFLSPEDSRPPKKRTAKERNRGKARRQIAHASRRRNRAA